MTFADSAIAELEASIRRVDSDRFQWLKDLPQGSLAKAPGSETPFLVPYLPFVGRQYEPGGVFLFATAQSFSEGTDQRHSWWGKYVGYGDDALYRLFRQEYLDPHRRLYRFARRPSEMTNVTKEGVSIGPFASGIMPAVAGLLRYAFHGEVLETLDMVTDSVAVTNLYKFTLLRPNGRDLNPKDLDSEFRDRYAEETIRHFVLNEIQVLKPGFVLGFDVPAWHRLVSALPAGGGIRTIMIQDPACLRRGWRGIGWKRDLDARPLPKDAAVLVGMYLDQCDDYHRKSKRDKAWIMLAGRLQRFLDAS